MTHSLIRKLFCVLKQLVVSNKCLNETTEVRQWGDIKRSHSEHGDSSTH